MTKVADRAARVTAVAVLALTLLGCGQASVPAPSSVGPSAAAGSSSVPTPGAPASQALLPPTSSIAAVVAVARVPVLAAGRLAALPGAVWAAGGSDVTRIDTATGATRDLSLNTGGDNLDSIAATKDALWLGDYDGGQVLRLDPVTGRVTVRADTGHPEWILAAPNAVWVTNHHEGTLVQLDPRSGRLVGTVKVGPTGSDGPLALAIGDGSLWVDVPNSSEVVRLDPQSGAIQARIAVPAPAVPCGGMLVTTVAVWVTSCGEAPVLERIDPATNQAKASIPLEGLAVSPVEIDGRLWLPEQDEQGGDGRLERIDTATNTVDRTLDIPVPAMRDSTAVVADGQLWVSDGQDEVLRIALGAMAGP